MKHVVIRIIRFYQKGISPLRPPVCKYTPTCSEYALTAIGRFGVWKGGSMALYRIFRCNPFSKGGYDPVPQKNARAKRKN